MMTLVRMSKEERSTESVWQGVLPKERIRKAIADAITSELGLGTDPVDVTVELHTPIIEHEISFRAVRDHEHWRKRVEVQAERAAFDDANGS